MLFIKLATTTVIFNFTLFALSVSAELLGYCYVPSRSCQGYKEDIYGDLHAGQALNNTCSSFKTLQPMKKFCSASDCTGTCVAPPKAFAAQSCVHQQKDSDVIGCVVMA